MVFDIQCLGEREGYNVCIYIYRYIIAKVQEKQWYDRKEKHITGHISSVRTVNLCIRWHFPHINRSV